MPTRPPKTSRPTAPQARAPSQTAQRAPSQTRARRAPSQTQPPRPQASAKRPPSPPSPTLAILNQPSKDAQTAETARLALTLRQLAIASAALRQVPGGGKAADALIKILDSVVNRGGRMYLQNGKLARTTPPQVAGLGDSWLVQVAPWAMAKIGGAVQAARVATGRFGAAVKANLKTATAYAAGKIRPLLDKMQAMPGLGQATAIARKAMGSAAALLGLTGATAAEALKAATKRPTVKRRASAAVVYTPPAPGAAPGAAPGRAPAGPSNNWTAAKWGAAALGAVIIVPKLLKH